MISRIASFVVVLSLLIPVFALASAEDEALMKMEHKMYEMVKNKDLKTFGEMLTDDAVNIDPGNRSWNKAAIIQYLTPLTVQEYKLTDMKVIWLDKDCAAVTYNFSGKAMMGDQPMPPGELQNTTIWVKKGGKWLARYHQETPIMPPPEMKK